MLVFILQINWELDPLDLELRESDAAVGLGPRGLPRSAGVRGCPGFLSSHLGGRLPLRPDCALCAHTGL